MVMCDAKRKGKRGRVKKTTEEGLRAAFNRFWLAREGRSDPAVLERRAGISEFRKMLERQIDTVAGLVRPVQEVRIASVAINDFIIPSVGYAIPFASMH